MAVTPKMMIISGVVRDEHGQHGTISGAKVYATRTDDASWSVAPAWTNSEGHFDLKVTEAYAYKLHCEAFGIHLADPREISSKSQAEILTLHLPVNRSIHLVEGVKGAHASVGTPVELKAEWHRKPGTSLRWRLPPAFGATQDTSRDSIYFTPSAPGVINIRVILPGPRAPDENGATEMAAAKPEGDVPENNAELAADH